MDHDTLFKTLLKRPAILQAFFEAFVPKAAPFIDFAVLEFLDKERITAHGRKRTGDLLIKTRFRGKPAGFLIHIEHQAQQDATPARRMLEYFLLDWQGYDLPVYPVAVLSYRRATPSEFSHLAVDFPNKRVLCFDFDVIDPARMDAEACVKIPNPATLALAARMRFKKENQLSLIKNFAFTLAPMTMARSVRDMVASFFFAYLRLGEAEDLQLRQEILTNDE